MSNKNVQRLGEILNSRMKQTAGSNVPITIELGVIGGDLSLNVDSIGTPIPKGDYMVDIQLNASTYRTSTENCGEGGVHNHRIPEDFRTLQPGDRVLVAWVGYEPIVIIIVVPS